MVSAELHEEECRSVEIILVIFLNNRCLLPGIWGRSGRKEFKIKGIHGRTAAVWRRYKEAECDGENLASSAGSGSAGGLTVDHA